MARIPRDARTRSAGQAALDYVAVLALCALVLAAGTGAAVARGGELASAVRGELLRALCVVTAGDCDRDRAPCVTSTAQRGVSASVNLAVVRLGRSQFATLERRSDGTFAVTLLTSEDAGADLGLGGSADVAIGGLRGAVSGELRAAALARNGHGRVWIVRSQEAADELLRRLTVTFGNPAVEVGMRLLGLPEPDQTFSEHGWALSADGSVSAGPAEGSGSGSRVDVRGVRRDRRTGRQVLYLGRAAELSAALEAGVGGLGTETTTGGVREDTWAIEVDRDGELVDLMILSAGPYEGSFSLPGPLQQAGGFLGVPAASGDRRFELESHLDLRDPGNRAAVEGLLRAVFGGGSPGRTRAPVSRALAARLREHAIVHGRTYEARQDAYGGGGTVAAGIKIGGRVEVATGSTRLLAAVTRGPDGTWRARRDCLA